MLVGAEKAFGSRSQINSFLYACVSAPPSSPQHSGAETLFRLLKPCCWLRPLSLADVASVALVMMTAGEFGPGMLTSRLSENVKEDSRKERRKLRVCAALLNEGGGSAALEERGSAIIESRVRIVWSSTRSLPPTLYDSTALCWCVLLFPGRWEDEQREGARWHN